MPNGLPKKSRCHLLLKNLKITKSSWGRKSLKLIFEEDFVYFFFLFSCESQSNTELNIHIEAKSKAPLKLRLGQWGLGGGRAAGPDSFCISRFPKPEFSTTVTVVRVWTAF